MLDYQHWTPEETDTLERAVYTGKTASETARRLGRSRSACHSKAHSLGRPFDPESRDLAWYAINRAIERDKRTARKSEQLRTFVAKGRIGGLVSQDHDAGRATWAVVSNTYGIGTNVPVITVSLPSFRFLDLPL